MKRILFTIIALCLVIIAAFIWYMSRGVDRDEVYYQQIMTYENVVYKTYADQELTLDIMMPNRVLHDEIPVVFFVHGGQFVSGEKSDLVLGLRRDIVPEILDEGYAIISIEYRLLDDNTHFTGSGPIADVKDAIRYITLNAETYNFDTDNFGLWGHEAGGYLALTAAYSPSGMFTGDSDLVEYVAEVNYVIAMSSITDLNSYLDVRNMTVEELAVAQDTYDVLFGDGFDVYNLTQDNFDTMNSFNPASFISIDTVPTFIIHGLADDVVNHLQSDMLESNLNDFSTHLTFEYHKILGGDELLAGLAETEVNLIIDHLIYFVKAQYQNN